MFSHFFGSYLISKNVITSQQFDELLLYQKTSRVKLGLIAVAENLLSEKQANEINQIQAKEDKRFGDIAVEKGYLTEEQVSHLLTRQGSPYMAFIHSAVENGVLRLNDINHFLSQYQDEYNLSIQELDAIKNDDVNAIAKIFIKTDNPLYLNHFSLLLRNIIRFASTDIYFTHSYSTNSYSFDNLACQSLTGKHEFFVGIAGNNNSLLEIANPFAKEEFPSVDEDAFDSICEFINCANGLFATELSQSSMEEDMLPPLYYQKQTIAADGKFYVVPVFINNKQTDLIIAMDQKLSFQK